MSDSLGDRMKTYEQTTRMILLPHSYTILRVDGRAFHSYLRGAAKPFDMTFINDMREVGIAMCQEISGVVFAYGQSDEISVLLSDLEPQTQPWFGGVVQKMTSISASIATAALIKQRGLSKLPHFDARVFTMPNVSEVMNYFIWRQRDAVRNSVSMAAQAKFSSKQLHGANSGQMQEMLWSQHGINWNDYPDVTKRGWVITKAVEEAMASYKDNRTGELESVPFSRSFWQPSDAAHFTYGGGFLFDVLLKGGPSDPDAK